MTIKSFHKILGNKNTFSGITKGIVVINVIIHTKLCVKQTLAEPESLLSLILATTTSPRMKAVPYDDVDDVIIKRLISMADTLKMEDCLCN